MSSKNSKRMFQEQMRDSPITEDHIKPWSVLPLPSIMGRLHQGVSKGGRKGEAGHAAHSFLHASGDRMRQRTRHGK